MKKSIKIISSLSKNKNRFFSTEQFDRSLLQSIYDFQLTAQDYFSAYQLQIPSLHHLDKNYKNNICNFFSTLEEIKINIEKTDKPVASRSLEFSNHHHYNKSEMIQNIETLGKNAAETIKQEILIVRDEHKNKTTTELKTLFKTCQPGQNDQRRKIALSSLLNPLPIVGILNPYAVLGIGRLLDYAQYPQCILLCYIEGVTPKSLIERADLTIALPDQQYADIEQFPLIAKYLSSSLSYLPKIDNKKIVYFHPLWGDKSERHIVPIHLQENELGWIGPNANAMKKMGNKIEAKIIAREAQVPTVLDAFIDVDSPNCLEQHAIFEDEKNYPLVFKDPFGGGGQNIRIAHNPEQAKKLIEWYKNSNINSVLVERCIVAARHIEVQMLGTEPVGERDCSVQNRGYKLLEEYTCSPEARTHAKQLAVKNNYNSAGTVEFLKAGNQFYFMEMNTRLQVEHPITEMTTGTDLVHEMIQLTETNSSEIKPQIKNKKYNYAIQARIYFEELGIDINGKTYPLHVAGKVLHGLSQQDFQDLEFATDIRVLSSVLPGDEFNNGLINPHVFSVVIGADDRQEGLFRLEQCLEKIQTLAFGLPTNVGLLLAILRSESFQTNQHHINSVEQEILPQYLQKKHQPFMQLRN